MKAKFIIVFLVTVLFFSLTHIENVCGERLFVNNTSDYSSIQSAIDNASDGDTILVLQGVYYENIIINKSVNLRGTNKDKVIVDGQGDNVIFISANNVTVSNLTVQNSGFGWYDSGISIYKVRNCVVKDNVVMDNQIGINLYGLSNNNTIIGNIIKDNQDGVWVWNSHENLIYNNIFVNNSQNAEDVDGNIWYNAEINLGNYWDDYNGTDANGDGIGDVPYNISDGNSQDLFPLMSPINQSEKTNKSEVSSFDEEDLYFMLVLGMIVGLIFIAPIAYWWRKKYFS